MLLNCEKDVDNKTAIERWLPTRFIKGPLHFKTIFKYVFINNNVLSNNLYGNINICFIHVYLFSYFELYFMFHDFILYVEWYI